MKPLFLILICISIFSLTAPAQSIIDTFSYSFDTGVGQWSTESLLNNGEWKWAPDGKADNGPYWNDRDSINSQSMGGAMVYDAALVNGPNNAGNNSAGVLISPSLDFSSEPVVYLRFHQYFRNFDAITEIEYAQDGGDWLPIAAVNQSVALNVETGAADFQLIDISAQVGGESNMQIRFVFEGDYYFWIVDDVEFYDGLPSPPTLPAYVGDSLTNFGYPYLTEDSDWPYVPGEIVVQFKQDTPEPDRQLIREEFAAERIDSCACGRLELWRLGDQLIVDGDTLSASGGSIGIQERVKGASAQTTIDGVDYNRYNYNQMQDGQLFPNLPFQEDTVVGNPTPADAILIAILDTGIDLGHDSLLSVLYHNTNEPPEGNTIDEDGNCLADDWYGWNFVDNNNNPDDDHSHGTHVAGIVWQSFMDNDPTCSYRLIPYKTHDYHGVATLFDVACATYQAQQDGASVINDSWGFYGNESVILSNAIDTAKINNILVVTAAGNDTTDLATLPQYPACYINSNIITVGAHGVDANGGLVLADFSNYDPTCVDILAPGVTVSSTVPGDTTNEKSGTSMAAPAVAAATAMVYCVDANKPYLDIKNNVLDCATKLTAFENFAKDGNVLNFDLNCLTPVEEPLLPLANSLQVFPNPFVDYIEILNEVPLTEVQLEVYSLAGQALVKKRLTSWPAGTTESLDLSQLPTGLFILSVRHSSNHWTYKIYHH